MQFKELFADDDAVSPVIGVILMVAITVILAAVIGTFVLGLGDQVQDNPPQAQFTFEFEDKAENNNGNSTAGSDVLTITHEGGEQVEDTRLSGSVDGAVNEEDDSSVDWQPSDADDMFSDDGNQVSAGDSYEINGTTTSTEQWSNTSDFDVDLNSATVRIVWTSEGGGNSDTLKRWDGPDA